MYSYKSRDRNQERNRIAQNRNIFKSDRDQMANIVFPPQKG